MERPYVIDALTRAGVEPNADLVDKVVELQRLVSLKIAPGPFSRRCAALIELSCRIVGVSFTKDKLYSALGYKFSQNEYAQELGLLKSTLKINLDSSSIWEKLTIIFGEDVCSRAQTLFQEFHKQYNITASRLKYSAVNVDTSSYKCACVCLVAQMEKKKLEFRDIIPLAEVDRSTLLKTIKIVREKLGSNVVEQEPSDQPSSSATNYKRSRGSSMVQNALSASRYDIRASLVKDSFILNQKASWEKEQNDSALVSTSKTSDQNNNPTMSDKRKAYEAWIETRKKQKCNSVEIDDAKSQQAES